jgi:hypothetical protein
LSFALTALHHLSPTVDFYAQEGVVGTIKLRRIAPKRIRDLFNNLIDNSIKCRNETE